MGQSRGFWSDVLIDRLVFVVLQPFSRTVAPPSASGWVLALGARPCRRSMVIASAPRSSTALPTSHADSTTTPPDHPLSTILPGEQHEFTIRRCTIAPSEQLRRLLKARQGLSPHTQLSRSKHPATTASRLLTTSPPFTTDPAPLDTSRTPATPFQPPTLSRPARE